MLNEGPLGLDLGWGSGSRLGSGLQFGSGLGLELSLQQCCEM